MFTPGKRYHRRNDIHDLYGGQMQGGISTPSGQPFVFLFTGEQGELYGYKDDFQPNGTYWYTGEGQVGDMQLLRGNLAIHDHPTNGKALHLFQYVEKGWVEYVGAFVYVGHHYRTAPDRNGNARQAIVFELALESSGTPGVVPKSLHKPEPKQSSGLWKESLSDLRMKATTPAEPSATIAERKVNVRQRSQAVKVYVLRRATGVCEGCNTPAPFERRNGTPYLEPHHIQRLADEGPDHPRWVAALCPNCHRRVHHGADGDRYNETLAAKIGQLEGT